jgi:hypothetical protein
MAVFVVLCVLVVTRPQDWFHGFTTKSASQFVLMMVLFILLMWRRKSK